MGTTKRVIHLVQLDGDEDRKPYWESASEGRTVLVHTDCSSIVEALLVPSDTNRTVVSVYDMLDNPCKRFFLKWSALVRYGGWYFGKDIKLNSSITKIEEQLAEKCYLLRSRGALSDEACFLCSESLRNEVLKRLSPMLSGSNIILDCNPNFLYRFYRGSPESFSSFEEGLFSNEDAVSSVIDVKFGGIRSKRFAEKVKTAKIGAEKLGVKWADAQHYMKALARWTKAGFPVRDQNEVELIESEVCRPCSFYRNGRCVSCRCRVVSSSIAVVNKIKMATEHCPKGKW